jgi:hypothetical protein
MNKPIYPVEIDEDNSFSFLSIGKKGIILKVVELAEIEKGIYNLGFGDYDFTTHTVNDKIESENGDAEKVLATVFSILVQFLSDNPDKSIFIAGSTPTRTRLYGMIASSYFDEFYTYLEILGGIENEFEPFQKINTTNLFY